MAQLVERTARLEISPPVAAPSVITPEAAAEAAPSMTLDAAAIARAIEATGYCVVDDALGAMHAEQLGAACRAVPRRRRRSKKERIASTIASGGTTPSRSSRTVKRRP